MKSGSKNNLGRCRKLRCNFLVSILDSEINKPRTFVISDIYLEIYEKYVALTPKDIRTNCLFNTCSKIVEIVQILD